MINNSFYLRKLAVTTACLLVIITSAFGQKSKCIFDSINGNFAFGATQTFYVGDPFDGIGQIEVYRTGKKVVERHERNRKWKLDGVPIKPGEVFTKAGNFTMTIESDGIVATYKVGVLPAKNAQRPVAKVEAYPIQTEYKVGNRFYIDGIKVVCHDANGKEIPVEKKDITFYTSISNTLVGVGYQCGGGYQFSTAGKKEIDVRYRNVTIGKFTINVTDGKTSPAKTKAKTIATGWYNLRTMNSSLNLDAAESAELRNASVKQAFYVESKGNNQVTLKMANGKYLGIADGMIDGTRLKAVSSPYLWNVYPENNADIYSLRPVANIQMVVNAAGEKNTNGTWVIIWTCKDFNAPRHAEFQFISANNPLNE